MGELHFFTPAQFLHDLTSDGPLAVLIGAGFSHAHLRILPLFRTLTRDMIDRHARWADQFPYASTSPDEIYEWIAQRYGRIALIQAIHETPSGEICLRLPRDWLEPWPRGQVWGCRPDERLIYLLPGPAWVLARLIAERALNVVLSTNWDTLVETYAQASGVSLHTPNDNHDPPTEDVVTLRVVETREDYYHPWDHESELVKYNGGAFTSRRVLKKVEEDSSRRAEWERLARRALVVSSSDLGGWRGEVWAEDLVKEIFRHHKVLILGVSGNDNVSYVTIKEIQVEELRVAERRIRRKDTYEPHPRFFALGYRETVNVRLVELLQFPHSEALKHHPRRPFSYLLFQEAERFPEWRSGLWSLMHQIYARLLLRYARESNQLHPATHRALLQRLDEEAEKLAGISPEEYWRFRGVNPWLTVALNVALPFWAMLVLPQRQAGLLRNVGDYRAPLLYVPFFQSSFFLASALHWIAEQMDRNPRVIMGPGLFLETGGSLVVPRLRDLTLERGPSSVFWRHALQEWSSMFGTPLPPLEERPLAGRVP